MQKYLGAFGITHNQEPNDLQMCLEWVANLLAYLNERIVLFGLIAISTNDLR